MKKTNISKILVILIIFVLAILICIPESYAIKPTDITGEVKGNSEIDLDFVDKLSDTVRTVGIFIAVGVLMVIGIKYMTGSIEEKATYKKSMMPYIIGCILLFGASVIAPSIIDIFKETDGPEDVGNIIIGLIQVIGTFAVVAVIMILGIKYMVGSTEERASYKKTMVPYVIGVILLFGAITFTGKIYDVVTNSLGVEIEEKKTCPYCGVELPERDLHDGVCRACGNAI